MRRMACMIPESPVETGSAAERRLFERLRDETPDEIVAFHSVAWQLPDDKGRPQQGESDFVLAHPGYGVLTLEIKGGSVRYDSQAGKWLTVDKRGESQIKDPARRAQDSSHLLRKALARAARDGGTTASFGYGVAFPDCRVDRRILRPNLPRELVLDHGDVSRVSERVERLFAHCSTATGRRRSAPTASSSSSASSPTRSSYARRSPSSSPRRSASSSA